MIVFFRRRAKNKRYNNYFEKIQRRGGETDFETTFQTGRISGKNKRDRVLFAIFQERTHTASDKGNANLG